MKDEELEQKMAKWELAIPDDPGFQSGVWREIATRQAASPVNRFREVVERAFTTRVAVPATAVAVFAVLLTATFHGIQDRKRVWQDLGESYSSSIDPASHAQLLVTAVSRP